MPLYIQSIFVFHKYDNLNNKRYYQLAGKIKTSEYFKNLKFESAIFNDLCDQNKVDKIANYEDFPSSEISEILNGLIDTVDKKTS